METVQNLPKGVIPRHYIEHKRAAELADAINNFTKTDCASDIIPIIKDWCAAFPDGRVKITNVITQDDWVVVEFTNSGTNTGPLKSATGDFPPTNRKVEALYCSVMQIEKGKVISGRDYYDVNSILRQLGL